MQCLFEEVSQFFLSPKYRNTLVFNCYYQIRIRISGHSKFNMDWNLFFQDCFYITLLIIMFIRMFDIQY